MIRHFFVATNVAGKRLSIWRRTANPSRLRTVRISSFPSAVLEGTFKASNRKEPL
jgi:hypothetical protein